MSFFLFLFFFPSSLLSLSLGYVATFIYSTTQVYHVSIHMVSSSHRELEVGSKPACNGTYELSETPQSRPGILGSFVPFEPSDFVLVLSSEISFPFLPLPGDGRGLGGVYFFDGGCLRNQGLQVCI